MLIYTGVRGVLVAYYSGVDWAALYKGYRCSADWVPPPHCTPTGPATQFMSISSKFCCFGHFIQTLFRGKLHFYPWESKIYTTYYVLSPHYVLWRRDTRVTTSVIREPKWRKGFVYNPPGNIRMWESSGSVGRDWILILGAACPDPGRQMLGKRV